MPVRSIQITPVRMTVDVHRTIPRVPLAEEEPLVAVRGVVDLDPDPSIRTLPIWFEAEVQIYADGSTEILSFHPAYGTIEGREKNRLMAIYKHAFAHSLEATKLRIIGVRPGRRGKEAISLSIGDRTLPLEADIKADALRGDGMVGKTVEVSPISGGDLRGKSGEKAKVTGVFRRFGEVVGYEVELGGNTYFGSSKDFFTDREYLEDIQPPTATSASLRESLSHWSAQRDYWHTRTDGLEAFCFDLASATPRALPECHQGGWRFLIPSPMPGDRAVVDCRAPLHGNFWSLGTLVYPERLPMEQGAALIEDHWARVFSWAYYIATSMVHYGYPWEEAARSLRVRAEATTKILRPLVDKTVIACAEAKQELTGESTYMAPGSLSVAFSDVRLKAATIGLLEPPTDRRPYAVMSISPSAVMKPGYLQQVVLHECLHFVVGSHGGDPHNELFVALAEKLGLREEYRD